MEKKPSEPTSEPTAVTAKQLTPDAIRAELLAVNARALRAYQRLLDISCFVFSGNTLASERDYQAFSASVRFAPWEKSRLTFERAKFEAERWMLRGMLTDGLRIAGDLTEACRSAAAFLAALADPGLAAEEVRKRAVAERPKFLRLGLAKRSEYLETTYGIATKLAPSMHSIADLTACLVARGGMVTKADCNTPEGLLLRLAAISLRPKESAATPDQPAVPAGAELRITEARKIFTPGQVIELSKEEHLTVILTFSLYVSTLVQSLQEKFPAGASGSQAGA